MISQPTEKHLEMVAPTGPWSQASSEFLNSLRVTAGVGAQPSANHQQPVSSPVEN